MPFVSATDDSSGVSVTYLYEITEDRTVLRSIELHGPNGDPKAAADLQELSTGRPVDSVENYDLVKGMPPRAPLPDSGEFADIIPEVFEILWEHVREELGKENP